MGNSMKTLVFAQKVQLIMEKNSAIVHHLVQLALELLIVVTVVLETSNSMEILALAQKVHLIMVQNFVKIVHHLVRLAPVLLIAVTVVLETSNLLETPAFVQKAHLTMAKNFAKIVRPTASLVLKVQQHAQVVMKIWFYLTKNVKELSMV